MKLIYMKFTAIAGKIASSLHNIIGIVNKKSVIQGLSNVKITLKGNFLELITTDSEISISETLEIEGYEDGQISIDATMLYDALRKIRSSAIVSFIVEKSRVNITSGATKFLIPFLTEDHFPSINEGDKKYSLTVPISDAINLFEKTKCAIALENTRINLTGIFLHSNKGLLCSATTDCNRLAYSISGINIEENPEIIIPRKSIMELNKLILKVKAKEVLMTFHGTENITRTIFYLENIKIITKLIVGQFPNYQKVIPETHKVILILETKNIIEVVERISIIAAEKNRAIKFNIFGNQLKVYMSNIDSGFAEEIIQLDNFNLEDELEIAVNYNYLLESLYLVDGKSVSIKIVDNKSPILIQDIENNNTGYVIMPMLG